jgi:hypothetical protein
MHGDSSGVRGAAWLWDRDRALRRALSARRPAGEIALVPDLADLMELRLEEVDVLLLVLQQALNQLLGVLHLADRLLHNGVAERVTAPVVTHLGVHEPR